MSIADAFFPGADDVAASIPDAGPSEPIKARRGRKPKVQPPAAHLMEEDASDNDTGSATTEGNAVKRKAESDETATSDGGRLPAPPSPKRRGRQKRVEGPSPVSNGAGAVPPPSATPAVRWNAETGTATFDWTSIEKVAATDGPNQTMAKLLLAARAEGANSRWPF